MNDVKLTRFFENSIPGSLNFNPVNPENVVQLHKMKVAKLIPGDVIYRIICDEEPCTDAQCEHNPRILDEKGEADLYMVKAIELEKGLLTTDRGVFEVNGDEFAAMASDGGDRILGAGYPDEV